MTYFFIFIFLLLFEFGYIYMARKMKIVDVPNDRSSHSGTVVRGGGIIFIVGILIWWILAEFVLWPVMLALLALSAVSFADDIKEVRVSVRLFVHLAATVLILWGSGIEYIWWPLGIVAGIGIINSFNFMDGINGLIGLYALIVLLSLVFVGQTVCQGFVDESFLVVSVLSSFVFCLFNFRKKAVCFSGDVGSIVVGGIVFYALGRLVYMTGNFGWLALIAVFGCDTAFTLIRRIMQRQNIFQSHRMHAYQLLSNELGRSQLAISVILASTQLVIDIPLIYLGADPPASLLYLGLIILLLGAAYLFILQNVKKARRQRG